MTKSIYLSSSLAFTFLFFFLASAHNKPGDEVPQNKPSHEVPQNKTSSEVPHNQTSHGVSFEFHAELNGCFSKVYAFGGSDIDTGNAHLLGGLPDGSTSHGSSLVKGPNGKGRLSDGRLVVDFLCDALSIPHLSPYKEPSANSNNGVNFAVAGSTALPGDSFVAHKLKSLIWSGVPLGFQTQIEWFHKFMIDAGCKGDGKGSCKADIGNSLFWIGEMGVSDYINTLGSSVPLPHITEISVRIVTELLKTLLNNGAKYIVVQGLPPVGCLPAYLSSSPRENRDHMGCAATANIGISSYNQILQKKLGMFRRLYPNCSILYADYWNAYLTILQNPKKYQIQETFKPCCDNTEGKLTLHKFPLFGFLDRSNCKDPQKFISWDGIHLTEAMNKNLADLFINQGFCKPSFSELVRNKRNM